jgi:hypothetical protein
MSIGDPAIGQPLADVAENPHRPENIVGRASCDVFSASLRQFSSRPIPIARSVSGRPAKWKRSAPIVTAPALLPDDGPNVDPLPSAARFGLASRRFEPCKARMLAFQVCYSFAMRRPAWCPALLPHWQPRGYTSTIHAWNDVLIGAKLFRLDATLPLRHSRGVAARVSDQRRMGTDWGGESAAIHGVADRTKES